MGQRGNDNTNDVSFELPSLLAAAHELKTPLVLLRQLSLQVEYDAAAATPELHRRLRMTTERGLRLVDGLTRAARLQDSLFDSESLEIKAICHLVAQEMQPLARELGQQVELKLPKRSLLAIGQYDLLTSLLVGLCDNALGHNMSGGSVVISGRERNGRIELAVRDSGPKLSVKQFKQLTGRLGKPQPVAGRPRSSGLGLWVADNFARSMSGTLQAHRHRDGGMTFVVSLPGSAQLSLL
jgi:signal transduction histidine kinase